MRSEKQTERDLRTLSLVASALSERCLTAQEMMRLFGCKSVVTPYLWIAKLEQYGFTFEMFTVGRGGNGKQNGPLPKAWMVK